MPSARSRTSLHGACPGLVEGVEMTRSLVFLFVLFAANSLCVFARFVVSKEETGGVNGKPFHVALPLENNVQDSSGRR